MGTLSPAQALLFTAEEILAYTPGGTMAPMEESGILVSAVWREAAPAAVVGIGGAAFGVGYQAAFLAAHDVSSATTNDAIYTVLSRGRY